MKKTITVLGASGKIGSKIAAILLKEGHHVKLVARTAENLIRFSDMGAEIIPGDITDSAVVAKAFNNADSAFVLLPPNFIASSYREFQRKVGDATIEAIQKSGIKYIVNLSSYGAHMHEGNGIIAGLAEQEVKLNQLRDVNVLHLRPAYFMDNALLNIKLIKDMGINGTTADPDYKIPMVATRDIAIIASRYLSNQDFIGKSVLPISGERNYSFKEFTEIIGNSIGKPDLEYIQFPVDQAKQAMISMGLSIDVANDITNMEGALKNGIMNYEKRGGGNSSPTPADVFAKEVFAPLYNSL
ncbi:MAG: NAD(P)H-binding protein [Bacteroidota bacterium]